MALTSTEFETADKCDPVSRRGKLKATTSMTSPPSNASTPRTCSGRRAGRRDDVALQRPSILPDEILKLLQTELSVSAEIAGKAFGLGRTSSYVACRTGDIPALRVGGKFVVPTARLRQMLGIESLPTLTPTVAPAPPLSAPAKQAKPPRRKRRRRS